jgi:hypothetical protein
VSDLWEEEGFGSGVPADEVGDDDWDEGEERLETSLEDAFDDPEELEGDDDTDDA